MTEESGLTWNLLAVIKVDDSSVGELDRGMLL